jgi:hypothetical protein
VTNAYDVYDSLSVNQVTDDAIIADAITPGVIVAAHSLTFKSWITLGDDSQEMKYSAPNRRVQLG